VKNIHCRNKENYKTLIKDIGTKLWKASHSHVVELILLKCPYFPKQFTNAVQSSSKCP
jgi:hypothetical protein